MRLSQAGPYEPPLPSWSSWSTAKQRYASIPHQSMPNVDPVCLLDPRRSWSILNRGYLHTVRRHCRPVWKVSLCLMFRFWLRVSPSQHGELETASWVIIFVRLGMLWCSMIEHRRGGRWQSGVECSGTSRRPLGSKTPWSTT